MGESYKAAIEENFMKMRKPTDTTKDSTTKLTNQYKPGDKSEVDDKSS